MSELRLCCFPMDIVKVKLEFEDKQTIEKTLYLRMGYVEHHRVTDKKIAFDSYEEMPSEYANITNVTVINVNNGSSTTPLTITTTTKNNSCVPLSPTAHSMNSTDISKINHSMAISSPKLRMR